VVCFRPRPVAWGDAVASAITWARRLKPDQALYNMRGSAKQALGDLDGSLADTNEAIRFNRAL